LRLVGALLTDPTKAGRNARPFSDMSRADTAKAFVDQQQHLLKAREQGAKVATPA
jgi:hypothetical protein